MAQIITDCVKCGNKFQILDSEQALLKEKGLPLPTICPPDRQLRRLKFRGGRNLFRTKCSKCGKDIIVSFDPTKVKQQILCKDDYAKYFNENDPIIKDPLPQD
jgi:DNA-directed RNA polymerase subunit RPC12/RpoP